jgi:hypothetical protein
MITRVFSRRFERKRVATRTSLRKAKRTNGVCTYSTFENLRINRIRLPVANRGNHCFLILSDAH